MIDWLHHFEKGFKYREFLEKYGSDQHKSRWRANEEATRLTEAQKTLLAGFKRHIKVICLSGTWCGDCANQCPIFEAIVSAAPPGVIDLRYIDRDAAGPELGPVIRVNGGQRVPVVIFLSEDGQEVARYGEKTLAKFRDEAAKLQGAACSLGIPASGSSELLAAVIAEWVDQFERAQLILRLSARLREKHGD